MSALPPEADMLIVGINVCYVPLADMGFGNKRWNTIIRLAYWRVRALLTRALVALDLATALPWQSRPPQ
jgi:hypothetical protein